MITPYGRFCFPGNTWNFHVIIFLSDNPVKLNSSSDSLFDKNIPFGVENKVLHRLWIIYRWEDFALTQMYLTTVSNNLVRGLFSTLVFWQIFNKLISFMSQLSNLMIAGVMGSPDIWFKLYSSTYCLPLYAKKLWAYHLKDLTSIF